MPSSIFTLTKNEQRVVVLVILALLAAAFVRYLHNLKEFGPNKPPESQTSPVQIDETQLEGDQAGAVNQTASPQSSP